MKLNLQINRTHCIEAILKPLYTKNEKHAGRQKSKQPTNVEIQPDYKLLCSTVLMLEKTGKQFLQNLGEKKGDPMIIYPAKMLFKYKAMGKYLNLCKNSENTVLVSS